MKWLSHPRACKSIILIKYKMKRKKNCDGINGEKIVIFIARDLFIFQ
jgi:hypothetical protein